MPRGRLHAKPLYGGQINLWVEDDLTRTYLNALWNDPAVKFLIGGSYQGVLAILKDAEDAGYSNVFGVVDGDHGRSNHMNWSKPGKSSPRFILPRHEIENYLLDTPALEGCRFNTHRRTPRGDRRVPQCRGRKTLLVGSLPRCRHPHPRSILRSSSCEPPEQRPRVEHRRLRRKITSRNVIGSAPCHASRRE